MSSCPFFFFNDTATTEIYTLSLHDALPIWRRRLQHQDGSGFTRQLLDVLPRHRAADLFVVRHEQEDRDRKSTRLNSSHANISYAVFCLKKNSVFDRGARDSPLRVLGPVCRW